MLQRIQPVQVADHDLRRHQHEQYPHRDRQPGRGDFLVTPPPQVKPADPDHDEYPGDIRRHDHMRETVRKGRVEDRVPPARHLKHPVRIEREAGGRETTYTSEPGTGGLRRLWVDFLKILPIESLL